MTRLYKHTCGYPIEEGSDLRHCPGCGGRITPWALKPGVPEPAASERLCLAQLATWLRHNQPDLAQSLAKAVNQALEGALLSETHACLSVLGNELQKAREEP